MLRPLSSTTSTTLLTIVALFGCNQPPAGHVVSISPSEPNTADELRAQLDELAFDPNDDVLSYRYAWYRDGALLTELDGETVSPERTQKGQEWTVEVTADDGRSDTFEPATATVTIQNSVPTVELDIMDDRVGTKDDIVATVETADLDEDRVTVDVTWTKDGATTTHTALRVPSSMTSKGEIWEVTVVASDGEASTEPVSLAARVANTPPEAIGAFITPAEPTVADELRCLSQGWRDDDGDEAAYRVAWFVNGAAVTPPGDTLTSEWFAKADEVTCQLTPWDGEDDGAPVLSEAVTVLNSPPLIASARLDPATPTTVDDLSVVVEEVVDPDEDEVRVDITWTVDGRAAGTGSTLSSSATRKGQEVSATLTPFDGEVAGPTYTVGPIRIANTAPVASSVTITPSTVRTNGTLTAVATGSDVDGDDVSFEYSWSVDGTTVPGSSPTLDGSTWFDKGDVVTVTVTPTDGSDAGAAITSSAVTVANTPPTAPAIRITPSSPTASDTLRCFVTTPGTDADGDRLTYTATWTRNGSSYTGASTTTFTGDTIASSATSSGDTWACRVTGSDGTDVSSAVSASVRVESWTGRRVFTNCSQTGQTGPTTTQCNTAYGSTNLKGEVSVSSGKQSWTVPITGTYRIEAFGAQGASAQSGRVGGRGARVRGDFSLTKGTVLTLVVGQAGTSDGCSGGGGGGSYVARGTTPLLVASGGGGTRTSVSQNGCDGETTRQAGTGSGSGSTWGCGTKSTSTIGFGGIVSSSSWGSAGGAWSRDGAYEYNANNRGRSFTAGSGGGGFSTTYRAHGGFGGGGAGNGSCGGGGGGGYSGGDGGRLAGGGGSYNTGSTQSASTGARSGQGQITIDLL